MFRTPTITKNLLIINIICFLAAYAFRHQGVTLQDILGLHFFMASDFRLYQLVTYMFMHANFEHILFNMFALWMFGRTMEQVWGPKKFLIFYMVCGIGAGVMQEVVQYVQFASEGLANCPLSALIDETGHTLNDYLNLWTTVGASGAVYGILLGFGMTFPNQYIMLLIPPMPLKAKYMVIGYAVLELLFGIGSGGDSVAHFAHLGGMLFGLLLILHWRRKAKQEQFGFTSWQEYRPKREPIWQRMKARATNSQAKQAQQAERQAEEQKRRDAEEIDRILDKIKQSGYNSLSSEEKKKLFDQSR